MTAVHPITSSLPEIREIPLQHKKDFLRRIAEIFELTINFPEQTLEEIQQACFDAAVQACRRGEWGKVARAHDEKLGIKVTDIFRKTLLMHAVSQWEKESVESLLRGHIAIHEVDVEGNSALHYAAQAGAAEIIEPLLGHLKKEARNQKGETALHIAIRAGQAQCVHLLLSYEANPFAPLRIEGGVELMPLSLAVARGEIDCLEVLVQSQKCSLNEENPWIGNLLHVAVQFHQIRVLHYLIEHHFPVVRELIDEKNFKKQTPLSLAAKLGDEAAIAILYHAGASLETRDILDRQPLHHAALAIEGGAFVLLVKLLVSSGHSLSPPDLHGATPLSLIDQSTSKGKSAYNYLQNVISMGVIKAKVPTGFGLHLPENITIQGGGAKGIGHIGALISLEGKGLLQGVRRVAGSSAGAITSGLYATGYTTSDLNTLLQKMDMWSFLDHPFTVESLTETLRHSFGGVRNTIQSLLLFHRQVTTLVIPFNKKQILIEALKKLWGTTGLCKGEKFREWIEELISKSTDTPYCTFKELRDLIHPGGRFCHLHVYGTGVNTRKTLHLHSEGSKWDDVIISDAIRISMSIPFVFEPHYIYIKRDGKRIGLKDEGVFCDGGLLYNSPEETFDRMKYLSREDLGKEGDFPQFNRKTICLRLVSGENSTPSDPPPVRNIKDLLVGVVRAFYNAEAIVREVNPYASSRIVSIDTGNVGMLSFRLKSEEKQALVDSGQKAMEEFIERNLSEHPDVLGAPVKALKTATKTLFLPAPLNYFTGRKELFTEVRQRFFGSLWAPTNSIKVLLLYGPPGIGKTEFSLAFGNQFLQDFSLIWFIQTSSEALYAKSYRHLANTLDIYIEKEPLEEIIRRVHIRLESHGRTKPWLLILDNVSTSLPLPQRGGCVLTTSTNRHIWPHQEEIPMLPFNEEESVRLLSQNVHKKKLKGARELCRRLDYSPLLIDLARGYIASTHTSVEEYSRLIEGKKSHPAFAEGSRYARSLAQSYTLTFDLLQSGEKYKETWEFLQHCAYLNPDRIERSLLEFWLAKRFQTEDIMGIRDRIIRDLENLSFIRYENKRDYFRLHGNLQFILEATLEGRKKELIRENTMFIGRLLLLLDSEKIEHWEVAEKLFPHADRLINLFNPEDEGSELEMLLLFSVYGGWLANLQYNMKKAKRILAAALPLFSRHDFFDEHPIVPDTLNRLGFCYSFLGKYQKALGFHEKALKKYQEIYKSKTDRGIVLSLNSLGEAWRALGESQKALKYHEEALSMGLQIHKDESHQDIAMSFNNLGEVWRSRGEYQKALECHKKALKMNRNIYKDKLHRNVAISLNNIGKTYMSLGKFRYSLKFCKRALSMMQEIYQEKLHRDTAIPFNNLGEAWWLLRDYQKALKFHEQALGIFQQVYKNKPHPRIAKSLNNLGKTWRSLKDYDKALEYHKKALKMNQDEIYENRSHPEIALSLNGIGKVLLAAGKRQEAKPYFVQAYKMSLNFVGTDHPDAKKYQENLEISKSCLRSLVARARM